ncbi:unnamed protein product [Paramecium sonneborni]|uniref:Calponin-homology (CH) domain-containing protein n=1 Tax=Paramecium sonneborni TaxID=65129 RepID=A0A8S1QLZ9_9CILI|nr:unnamed protein product [Paramecium sonneborni]
MNKSSLNSSKIKQLSSGAPIEVVPNEIIFKDIQINQTYEITVFVRNLTQTARRIRVFQPHSNFRCDYEMQGAIAAGLSMKLIVTFETANLESYSDSLKIVTDGQYSVDIPLHAFPAQAAIIYEPFINLGFVRMGKEKMDYIHFKNEGKAPGKVELKLEKIPDFRIDPNSFALAPGQEFSVSVFYKPKDAGIFRGIVEVIADGQQSGLSLKNPIDINATSIEFTRFLIDQSGTQNNHFDFGTIYYGQQKQIEVYLVNNTPKQQKFKVQLKKGLHEREETLKLQTPAELGLEQTERIMECWPEEGTIESYSQTAIIFKCKPKVSEELQIRTKQYAMNQDKRMDADQFQYSAIFDFYDDEPLMNHLSVNCVCPQIKFPPIQTLQFGQCGANLQKDLIFEIQNLSQELPILISFPNIPYFSVTPPIKTLGQSEKINFQISFKPKHIGQFASTLNAELLGGIFKIPIRLTGFCQQILPKPQFRRGPECQPQDFEITKDRSISGIVKTQTDKVKTFDLSRSVVSVAQQSLDKIDDLKLTNKEIYNEYLKGHRAQRIKKDKEKMIKLKFTQMTEKLNQIKNESLLLQKKKQQTTEEEKPEPPIDYEFVVGMHEDGYEQDLNLPDANESLFVTKPIYHYEPITRVKEGNLIKPFDPDPKTVPKKKFPNEPKTHSEIRDTSCELTPEQLLKISAGPVKIDFGNIFIKSLATKFFYVRNELRNSIAVRLHTDREDFAQSYLKPQIIPSGQTAGFDVCVKSRQLGQLKSHLKYIINEKHIFEIQISATIEKVFLEMSRQQVKLTFTEDNTEMETIEILRLTNNGNADAKFKWITSDKKTFTVKPEDGIVPFGKYFECQIVYRPSLGNNQQQNTIQASGQQQQYTAAITRTEEEKITLKTEEGIDQTVKCIGVVTEPKCSVKQGSLDFKDVVVCKPETKIISVKNHSKSTAVFAIKSQIDCIEVMPMKGRIHSDESKDIQVKFFSKEEKTIKGEIVIQIRGGKLLIIPFQAQSIIPKIEIEQMNFEFGNVTTLGTSNQMPLTLVNSSPVSVELVLDLRPQSENPKAPDGIECLEFKPQDDDDTIMHSVHPDQEDDEPKEEDPLDDVSEKSEPIEIEQKIYRQYNISIGAGKTQQFLLRFSPKEVKQYSFDIPLTLARFGILPTLLRRVTCKGLKPKFLVEPQAIEFKKKIITSPDKCFPTVEEIKLSNPDKRDVHWKIDAQSLKSEKIFSIEPQEGVVPSGQQSKIRVKFNPYGPGQFNGIVQLYILSDPDIPPTLPYVEIQLSGSGAYPRLLFDKKEIILPVVPLGIQSRCFFRIINDGYENLNLKYNWAQEISNFNLDLKFPEGTTLGVAKSKLRVEVVFSNKKPLSFTTRVEFIDEARVYSIYISGTTDNCIFTNQSFLWRMGRYQLEVEDKKPILYVEDENVDSDNEKYAKHSFSVRSSTSSKGTANLGYTPVRKELFDQASEYIIRWLNYHVLTTTITMYPEEVINSNGQQIFELITFLTGKQNFSYKQNVDPNWKKSQRAEALYKQYDEMIRQLKIEGALLNHIRSEYLLSYQDYLAWLKVQPPNKFENVPENMLRLNPTKYNYLQQDAWISLFYQIMKIYYLNRITVKTFKALPGIPTSKLSIPEYYLEGSNLISQPEGILLYFYEICYEMQHQIHKRIKNFDQDFKDSTIISDALTTFIGPSMNKFFINFRSSCHHEEDYKHNTEKLMPALQDFGLQSHIQSTDIYRPQCREMIMLLVQLFFSLPYYIPQKEPIFFSCVLGEEVVKSIELKNPTQKPISYWVKYEGHPDFQLEGDESIKIEPDVPYQYKIKFTSRISQPVSGRVIFTNKKESNIQAAALVFELKSSITGRKSEKQWNVSSILYEIFDFQIQITNKFLQDGEFQIIITHEKKQIEQQKKKGKSNQQQIISQEEEFPAFFCQQEKVRIRKNQTINLTLQYIPLTMDTHKCQIVLTDPQVGEFQHDLQGTVELPNLSGEFKPEKPLYVDQTIQIPYQIPFKNEYIIRARQQIQQIMQIKQKNKQQQVGGDKINTQNNFQNKLVFPGSNIDQITFELEVFPQTQYLQIPQILTVGDGNKKQIDRNNDGKLPITYAFKNATKDFSVILTLKNKFDIRRYKLSASVLPKIVKATLEFRVPARQQVIQEIPIVNNSDKEWSIKVQIIQPQDGLFQCPNKDFQVKKKSTGLFPITFNPQWISQCEARLVLSNPQTNDVFEYDLIGIGEEPVAEEHIILNCQARKQMKREIEIKNNSDKMITYKVETDLIYATGPSTITVQAGKKAIYQLIVQPVLSGQYTGSITFTEENGRYLWYTVFMNTESPKSVQTLELSCLIRQATVIQLTLANPLPETAIYEAIINGDGLIGEDQFAIGANKEGNYELTFAPLKVGRWRGSVAFVNRQLGEVWYEFILTCEEQPIIKLNVLKASLGKVEQQTVILENPSDTKINLQHKISNPTNFDISPDELIIQPYDILKVNIKYTPSSLDQIEQSEIIFTSPIGKWHYLVFGNGLPPTKFPATTVSIGLNKDYSSVVHFKNPFKDPITVKVDLEAEGHNKNVFKLLTTKTDKILVPGMNVLQIPFSFVPREITSYYTEIVIQMNEKISWNFPIKGVTESVSNQTLFHFKAKCRDKWEDEIKIGLQGIAQSLQADDKFDFELANIPIDLQQMINKCFSVKCTKNYLNNPHENLHFAIRFQPMKPLKASLEFIVLRQSGGRWKYKIVLEATQPDEDDVIIISSPLNKTTSVSFKLTNKTKGYAKFYAGFTPESDAEFSVIPKIGDLEPYGREGTTFVISFTPIEYGKIRKGKLVIQTEEMYWSYLIKGILPKYIPPQIKQSNIDNHQNKSQIQQSTIIDQSKNYIVENIKKARQLTPPASKRQNFLEASFIKK